MPKVPKQGKARRDGVINPQNYNFNKFQTHGKLYALKTQKYIKTSARVTMLRPSGSERRSKD